MSKQKHQDTSPGQGPVTVVLTPISRTRPCVGGTLLRKEHCETPRGVSMCVPDQGLSLKDLVNRFRTTGDVREGSLRKGFYSENADFDDEDLEKVSRMDIQEQDEVVANATMRASLAKAELDKAKADEDARTKDEATKAAAAT